MAVQSKWVDVVRLSLRVGLVVGIVLVGLHYLERYSRKPIERAKPAPIERPDDFYVVPPKSYVNNVASAPKLVGKPLWVKEGYRRASEPGGRLLEPLEKIVPTAIAARGEEAILQFEHGGKAETVSIGSPDRLFVDDIFFIKDPREIYSHWTPEDWEKIEKHEIEPGMTEFQVIFALGAGQTVRASPQGETRVVDFVQCKAAGLQPVRVTFKQGHAAEIVPLGK